MPICDMPIFFKKWAYFNIEICPKKKPMTPPHPTHTLKMYFSCYFGMKKFSYGFKSLVKLGVGNFFQIFMQKIWAGRTVFRKSTPNLTITRCKFGSNFEVFWNFFKKPLKVPGLARSVPKSNFEALRLNINFKELLKISIHKAIFF